MVILLSHYSYTSLCYTILYILKVMMSNGKMEIWLVGVQVMFLSRFWIWDIGRLRSIDDRI